MEFLSVLSSRILYLGIHLLDAMGFVVIFVSGIRAFWDYWTVRTSARLHFDRLRLAEGLASGLEFKLGGEILRTVVIKDWEEILVVGAIVVLRALMSLMINWEILHQRKNRHALSSRHEQGIPPRQDVVQWGTSSSGSRRGPRAAEESPGSAGQDAG